VFASSRSEGLKLLTNVDALLAGKIRLLDITTRAVGTVAWHANRNDGWNTSRLCVCGLDGETKASRRNRSEQTGSTADRRHCGLPDEIYSVSDLSGSC
jgi:hypothetical protein